ncbi:GNAT family N-acetyltransferase [Sporomusa malonica]|uniref:Acetyltransferase (GNAT) domain-containing protein n=1 Tax=Sporomusa malonica TaxID=112901 RepID=A0A1W1ZQ52_9FIRM|nr:GNAT family N-acetyltransferase [Sporomusa malonica]SMC50526.1 Acetyltransferase (GNAT) domain-containing protein [Sporomusa malonica]
MEIRIIKPEQTWELRQTVMWPDKEIAYVKLPDDPMGIHYGLFENGQLISVVSAFAYEQEIQFRKFATVSNKQGLGYGTQLLQFVIDAAKASGAKAIWCNARKSKTAFYRKIGFEERPIQFKRDGIDYVVMSKNLTSK